MLKSNIFNFTWTSFEIKASCDNLKVLTILIFDTSVLIILESNNIYWI